MGTISGGQKDEIAPRLKENGVNPPNGSTQFATRSISLTFDEYVKLNNPLENITLVPEHAKVKARLHKKTVVLDIVGDLQPETTYKITLNKAVKDLSEGNDSLMQYVFSTGVFIDSLNYSTVLKDAKTSLPIKNATLAFYELTDSALFKKPSYYAKSDINGKVQATYMKSGTYQLIAFEDLNSDLKLQKNERYGFKTEPLNLNASMNDSLGISIFDVEKKGSIRTKRFEGPSLLKIGATQSLEDAVFSINDTILKEIMYYSSDSVGILLPSNRYEKVDLVIQSAIFQDSQKDTLLIRLPEKEKNKKPQLISNLKDGKLALNQTLILQFSDRISLFDSTKITVKQGDSLLIPYKWKQFSGNQLEFTFPNRKNKDIVLKINEGALTFQHFEKPTQYSLPVSLMQERDYGSIILFTDSLQQNTVLELIQNKTLIRTIPIKGQQKINIDYLEAGVYQVQGYLDDNTNEKWDVGDLESKKQPEKRIFFNQEITVRANWELEITLQP